MLVVHYFRPLTTTLNQHFAFSLNILHLFGIPRHYKFAGQISSLECPHWIKAKISVFLFQIVEIFDFDQCEVIEFCLLVVAIDVFFRNSPRWYFNLIADIDLRAIFLSILPDYFLFFLQCKGKSGMRAHSSLPSVIQVVSTCQQPVRTYQKGSSANSAILKPHLKQPNAGIGIGIERRFRAIIEKSGIFARRWLRNFGIANVCIGIDGFSIEVCAVFGAILYGLMIDVV
jgi:hypothetical protein